MELRDLHDVGTLRALVGVWKKKSTGRTSYNITTYSFSWDGTYSSYEETSMFVSNPLGSLSNSWTSSDSGTFNFIGPGEIEMVSKQYGRSVKKASVHGGILTVGHEQYFQ